MTIKWLNAVIDIPAEHFDEAGEFWVQLTNSTRGEIHPDHDEFVHLLPESGDMHLELQRISSGPAGAHLDLVVDGIDEIAALTEQAEALGATVVARPGHTVLHTPGGVPFCIVPGGSEFERASVIDAERPHAVDQICLDVPYEHFDADVEFWSALTGWDINDPSLPEYRSFAQPEELPLRILIQRLGEDDTRGARSHLDLSSGTHLGELTEEHRAAGGEVLEAHTHWTAMTDPAGMVYCITTRPPF